MGGAINFIWLDSETTGLDANFNDVIQLACLPYINGVAATSSFNEYCQPINWDAVDDAALRVNGITRQQLKTFQSADKLVDNLVKYLDQFNVKFTIAGFNVGFDKDFIAALFKKVGRENDFLRLFTTDIRDTLKKAKLLKSKLNTENLKLSTLCKHFDIEINAHDALSDIIATAKLDKVLSEMLGDNEQYVAPIVSTIVPTGLAEPAQLHLHSMYSHTDSLPSISEWVDWCKSTNTPGFSIVDHGNAASLYEMVRVKGEVTPIPGSGLFIELDGRRFYLNAWAISNVGYKNLIKLSSLGWTNKVSISDVEFPLLKFEDIKPYSKDIRFGIPGSNGPIVDFIASGDIEAAENCIKFLSDNLNVYLELAAVDIYRYFDKDLGFRLYNVPGGNIQAAINSFYFKCSKTLNIPLIPVSDAHFIAEEDKIVQDCIYRNSYKDGRYLFETRKAVLVDEMFSVLKRHIAEFTLEDMQIAVKNTHTIMDAAKSIHIKNEYHLPKIEIPDYIKQKTDDYNMQTYYLTMALIKEHGRWNDSPEYVERFKKEIDVVMKNETINFLPYFLMYEDICRYVRKSGFLQNLARGSAGGSLLSYYLKIIHIDPVANSLPFERFLSHARIRAGSFPDIDLDIADNARPHVMQYLKDKYSLGFAQIATFNKMKTKNAIKDAMWALYGRGRNDPEVEMVCKSIPDSPQGVDEIDFLYGYTDREGVEHKGQIHVNDLLKNFFNNKPEIEKMVKKLIGAIRGWSRHASAFVVATIDLAADRVPTMVMDDKELGTILVTQFDGAQVEKSGLVKADILGLRTLTMTSHCIKMIKENHGVDFLEEERGVPLLYRLPDADKGVFADFYMKKTDSSFQFNSELIKGYVQEFAPLNRADLASLTALCRPGALDAPLYDTTATQYYMDVRNGKRDLEFIHPDLKAILSDTNGVFVYQESILKFLVEIVGYSWEESDLVRSAIAKKKHDVIMATFDRIREACSKRGWSDEAIETICQQVQAFSNYSFNRSHSFAYGELGYITMYLKHHYPLEWWCGVLSNETDEDKLRKHISYLGDTIKAPSLRNPSNKYVIRGKNIVAPLSAIKGIGPAVVNQLVQKGPFTSLEDYVARVDHSKVNIGSMSALIKGRVADDLMDSSIIDYKERRRAFMRSYRELRKIKTDFKPEMYSASDIDIFLDEKNNNQAFNKNFLTYEGIDEIITAKWAGLIKTNKRNIPYMLGDVPVLSGIKIAETLLHKGFDKEVGMILLFEESNFRQGVSAKTGKKWSRVAIKLSDGFNFMECTDWNGKCALGFPKNSIVYVRGRLTPGWKYSVNLNITDKIEIVQ